MTTDQLENIDIDENALAADLCRESFYFFLCEFWNTIVPDDMVENWHMQYLCDELQKVAMNVKHRKPKEYDLIINIPPGTSKSTICTIMFPAWCWTIDPTLRFITGSYSGSLALEHAVKSRDVIKSEKYKAYFPDIKLKQDQDNKSFYQNNKNGSRVATSVGGGIMGKHAHILCIDDAIDPQGAASESELEKTNTWFDETLPTRKVDKKNTPTILVMQRLHENDPTGHLLSKQGKKIKHICLPAELDDNVSPPEVREKYINGLLDPVRMDKPVLDDMSSSLGSYGYTGQFGQKPAPKGGKIWQKWFIEIPDNEFPKQEQLKNYGTDWDLAYTKEDKNSASAYVVSGMLGNFMYIDDLGYDFLEFPDLITYMKRRPETHWIEAKASGKSAKQTLNVAGIGAREVKVIGGADKEARARMATPKAEGGLVFIRQSLADKLYNDSKQGILSFPSNSHDDLADVLSQAIQRHFNKPKLGSG